MIAMVLSFILHHCVLLKTVHETKYYNVDYTWVFTGLRRICREKFPTLKFPFWKSLTCVSSIRAPRQKTLNVIVNCRYQYMEVKSYPVALFAKYNDGVE